MKNANVLYSARARTTGGRDGASRSSDGIDVSHYCMPNYPHSWLAEVSAPHS